MRRLVFLALCVCGALAGWGQRVVAQQADTTQQDTTGISLAEIPVRATAVLDTLRLRYEGFRTDTSLNELRSTVARTGDSLETERVALDSLAIEFLSLRRIEDIMLRWRAVENQVRGWQVELTDRGNTLDSLEIALSQAAALWQEARDAAGRSDVPETVLDRIATVLALIDSVEIDRAGRLQEVLDTQGDVSALLEMTGGVLDRMEGARALARRRTLVQTDPPIWRIRSESGGETLQKTPFGVAELREFALERQVVLWTQLLIFVILAILTVALRRKMGARPTEEVPAGVQRALRYPLTAAVLLALVITPLLHDPLPGGVAEFGMLLVALAVFRLAPLYVHPPRLAPLTALLLVVVGHQMVELYITDVVILRLEFFVLAAAMGLALEAVRRAAPARHYLIDKLLYLLAQVGILLLGIAFIANALGFINLVIVIVDGAVGTMIITVALVIAVDAIEGIVSAISHQRFFGTIPGFRLHQAVVTSRTLQMVRLGAVLLWVSLVSGAFGVSDLVWDAILAVWRTEFALGAWTISVGSVLIFVLSVWVSVAVGRTVRAILRDDVLRRMRLARGMPNTIATLTFYGIVILGFLFGVGAAGVDLSALALVFGALGVGIGFGLQNIVNDFISGLVLMFERPIQIGDIVQLDDLIGNVTDIGIRASTVKTFEGAEVIVPNGQLVSARVVNWTLSDRTRRIDVQVGVAYGTSPSKVIALLLEIAEGHEDVRSNPEPLAFFKGFGESSLDFELRIWTNEFLNWRQVASDVTVAINDALVEAGIEIPFPQRDLHVRSIDEDVTAKMLKRGSSTGGKSRKR
jgi:small-conductance mechanosensitive channel